MRKSFYVIVLLLLFSLFTGIALAGNVDPEFSSAMKYYNSKNYKKAAEILREYVKKHPYAPAYYRLGYALYKSGNYDEGNKYFDQAYLVDPLYAPPVSKSLKKAAVSPPAETDKKDQPPATPPGAPATAPAAKTPAAAPAVTPAPAAKAPVALPAESQLPVSASVNGKYSGLIQVLKCQQDEKTQGEFKEFGKREAGPFCGQEAKAGFWVWVTPNWYVWEKINPAAASKPAAQATPQAPAVTQPAPPPAPTPQPAAPAPQPAPAQPPSAKATPIPKKGTDPGAAMGVGAIAGILAAFGLILMAVGIVVYVFFAFCMFKIAQKLSVPMPWLAFVPIAQVWTFVTCAGKPWWWIILLFVPFVNMFVGIYLWMCIAENLGKNKLLGILMIIPIVNFVILGMLAFSKSEAPVSGMEEAPLE